MMKNLNLYSNVLELYRQLMIPNNNLHQVGIKNLQIIFTDISPLELKRVVPSLSHYGLSPDKN